MINRSRRSVLSLLGAGALMGCSAPALVTRGEDPFEGGIGGTGIVGIVTGFGSILINGLTVELTGRTEIRSSLGASSLDTLQPGQSVTIFATRNGSGLYADRITQDYLLIGRARQRQDGLWVNGVRLILEPGSLGRVTAGQRVAVSGVWQHDRVVASRIDPAPISPDIISGAVKRSGGTVTIGSAILDVTSGQTVASNRFAVAAGTMLGDTFSVDRLTEGRFDRSARLEQISAEGFLEPTAEAPGFRLSGLGHSFSRTAELSKIGQRRALYFGLYNGLFEARRGYVVPEDFSKRRESFEESSLTSSAVEVLDL